MTYCNSASRAFASFRSRVSKPSVNTRKQFALLLHLALVAPEPCQAHGGGACTCKSRSKLNRRHLFELLDVIRYQGPLRLAVAIDMHFRIEPTRVVESVSFNEAEFGHDGNLGGDWRSALWTEVSLNQLTTIASVVKRLKLALNRNCRFRDSNLDRESRSLIAAYTQLGTFQNHVSCSTSTPRVGRTEDTILPIRYRR